MISNKETKVELKLQKILESATIRDYLVFHIEKPQLYLGGKKGTNCFSAI